MPNFKIMNLSLIQKIVVGGLGCFLISAIYSDAKGQTRTYRGSVGNSHIQMTLNFEGTNVSGTYAYDSVGQDIKLAGTLDSKGRLELKEFAGKGKQNTGKFVCERSLDDPIDSECTWSRPDGTRASMVTLEGQYVNFTNGLQIKPKVISNRKTGVDVSYPQITSSGPLSAGAQSFNRRIVAMVQKEIAEFQPVDGKGAFDANYNVLLGTNDLISVELAVYYDGGGAHPNNYFLSLTYDLSAGKELKFEDLFQPGSDFNSAIARFTVADIDRRAAAMEEDDARRENRSPNKRDEPIVSTDQLTELSGWAMTPKGLAVYFDFPHVIAVFDKTFVPYSVVKQYLKPNGPAAKFQ